MKRCSQSGFSFLEMVVMIVVIGIILAITIPKFQLMLYQSREARTKTNLGEIRGAVAIYYSDNAFLYPSDEGTPTTRLSSVLIPKYLKTIPSVELPHFHAKKMNMIEDHVDDQGDWIYITLDGFVGVNCTHVDTKGVPVSSW